MATDGQSKDKDDSQGETPTVAIVLPSCLMNVYEVDTTIEQKIDEAVSQILLLDGRLSGEPETVFALKDYIRAEIVCQIVFKRIAKDNSDSTGDERLFRAVLNSKNMLRDEIWGRVKGRKKREQEINKVRSILIDQKIIEAKKETDLIGGKTGTQ